MKYLRFFAEGKVRKGILSDDGIREIEGDFFGEYVETENVFKVEKAKLLAPVQPSKIVCVGLNYTHHAKELEMDVPAEPILFLKPPSSVIGPGDDIVYPAQAEQLDYEAELALVIKEKLKSLTPDQITPSMYALTCLNDVTARDLQKIDGQWTRAKSFDTFCPIGPHLVDDVAVEHLKVESFVNGHRKQSSDTSHFIFSIERLLAFVCTVMTLFPGDVVSTGTPPGVGPLQKGDVVEVRVEKVGSLINRVV